jgi:hypothetical protein
VAYWTGATAAFAAELAALAALCAWGFTVPGGPVARTVAGVGMPLVAAVLWGVFAAPRAPVRSVPLAVSTKILVLGGAVMALAASGHPGLAIALAAVIIVGQVLTSMASVGSTAA